MSIKKCSNLERYETESLKGFLNYYEEYMVLIVSPAGQQIFIDF